VRLATAFLIAILSACVSNLATARTWYILPDGSGDAPTIQAGMDSATAGDTLLLACGTYYEHGISLISEICVRSETGSPQCVTVDGQEMGSVLRADSVDGMTSIEGLTIRGGHAATGGGLLCIHAIPRVKNCAFLWNGAYGWQGGGAIAYHSSVPLEASIEGTKFVRNSVADAAGPGAVLASGVSLSVVDCVFEETSGSAVGVENASGIFKRCTFTRNDCLFGGALAFYLWPDHKILVDSCQFVQNTAEALGSALWQAYGLVEVSNSVFWDNHGGDGGALYSEGRCRIRSCTFTRNSTAWYAGVLSFGGYSWLEDVLVADNLSKSMACLGCPVSLSCCDIYGNSGGDWVPCIADQYGINGNFSADPLFCDADVGDFTLRADSPCLPGQHPDGSDCGLIGAFGEGCAGPTSVERATWGAVKRLWQ